MTTRTFADNTRRPIINTVTIVNQYVRTCCFKTMLFPQEEHTVIKVILDENVCEENLGQSWYNMGDSGTVVEKSFSNQKVASSIPCRSVLE